LGIEKNVYGYIVHYPVCVNIPENYSKSTICLSCLNTWQH